MITAEVEIDNNSDLEYFKSLQSKAWPTSLVVPIRYKINSNLSDYETRNNILLKIEPSLTDIIFLLVEQNSEEFKGYIWLKIDVYNKCYKLINYKFFLENINYHEFDFDYPTNIIGKIIKHNFDLKVEDKQLIEKIIDNVPRIKLENGIIKSDQNYFDGLEALHDSISGGGFNTQYIKWTFNPEKYKFWPGCSGSFLNNHKIHF
jgi:hypothetical protein